jgi:hypothetical protein
MLCRKGITACDDRAAKRAKTDAVTFSLKLVRSGRCKDGTADASALLKPAICRIHNSADAHFRYVITDNFKRHAIPPFFYQSISAVVSNKTCNLN